MMGGRDVAIGKRSTKSSQLVELIIYISWYKSNTLTLIHTHTHDIANVLQSTLHGTAPLDN
jgi:hypothetical protein